MEASAKDIIRNFAEGIAYRNLTWREALRALAHREIPFDVEILTQAQIKLGSANAQELYEEIIDSHFIELPVEIDDPTEIRNIQFTDRIKTEEMYFYLTVDGLIIQLLKLQRIGNGIGALRVIIDGQDITSITVTEVDQGFVVILS